MWIRQGVSIMGLSAAKGDAGVVDYPSMEVHAQDLTLDTAVPRYLGELCRQLPAAFGPETRERLAGCWKLEPTDVSRAIKEISKQARAVLTAKDNRPLADVYRFSIEDGRYTAWLEVKPKYKLSLYFTSMTGAILGEGQYRLVRRAIQLKVRAQRPVTVEPGVEHRFQSAILKKPDAKHRAERGVEIQRVLYRRAKHDMSTTIHIAKAPKKLDDGIYYQPAYESAMEEISCDARTEQDRLQYLCDIAGTMKWIQRLGYAHRDLHGGNVLIREGNAYLADFDLAVEKMGWKCQERPDQYFRWDVCLNEQQIVTPYADRYGMSMLLAVHALPFQVQEEGLYQISRRILMDYKYDNERSAEEYARSYPLERSDYDSISTFQQEALKLFFQVCIESAQLFVDLKQGKRASGFGNWGKTVTLEDVNTAMTKLAQSRKLTDMQSIKDLIKRRLQWPNLACTIC